MKSFLEDIDGFEAKIDNLGAGFQFAVAEPANQVFDAMGDSAEPLEADLSCGSFYGVDGAEKLVDFFRAMIGFKREQAVADDLQMLFGFRLKEFENF